MSAIKRLLKNQDDISFRFLFIFVLVTFFCSLVNAIPAHAQRQSKHSRHFLWSVESGRNTIYLLGSMHILKSDAYPLPREFESAYEESPKIVFETDLDGMNSAASQAKMMKLGLYPEGRTLSQNISERTYRLFKSKVTSAGLPMAQFDRMKPWFGALTLTSLELMGLGFDSSYGIDKHFFDRAGKDKKEVVFLETNEYQINLFAGLSKRHQEILLRQMLKELEVVEAMFSDMMKAWKTGDTDKLESILNISFEEYPYLYKRLIINRNKRWISKIQKLMSQNEDVLIIVGAGHLVGKDSVIELLEKKGYKVRQR
jgi:uncharacterized protein YbaP (TraB family)